MNACENKRCGLLFETHDDCEHRKEGKLMVCDFMNQSTGMCMSKTANGPEKKRNKNKKAPIFKEMSDKSWRYNVAKKESGYVEDILPYSDR